MPARIPTTAIGATTPTHWIYGEMRIAPLVWTPIAAQCEACVIVPVCDEAATLGPALRALAHQRERSGHALDHRRYEVIVLANNCRDESAAVARQIAAQYPALPLHVVEIALPAPHNHVGRARRLLMDEAAHRLLSANRPRGVILSTDGDTRATPTWIAETLRAVHAGAEMVGGRILTDARDRAALPPPLRATFLRDVGYQYLRAELETCLDPDPDDPWPRHYQHTGASLAVTAEAYRRAGGLPDVRVGEDVALYAALRRVDARIRHSPAVCVITSLRQAGRAAGGMATQLGIWASMERRDAPVRVASPADCEAQIRLRHRLRVLWRGMQRRYRPASGEIGVLACDLGIEARWLSRALLREEPFGMLMEQIEAMRAEREREHAAQMDISEAIAALRMRLAMLRPAVLPPVALPEVEPVLARALPAAVTETGPLPRLEGGVDRVTRQRGVVQRRGPMDEEQVSTTFEMLAHPVSRPSQIIQ